MSKFGTSQPPKRVEDLRFLTGEGRYVDDIAPKDALFALVFRSPVAHADITGLDLEAARAAEGVHAVISCADLDAAGVTGGLQGALIANRDGSNGADPERPFLARDRVRFVGEAVAVVVAETLAQARDALELIEFEYDDLEVHLDLAQGGPDLHAEAPGNLAFDWALGDEDAVEAALAGSAHRVKAEIGDNRIICNAMEPRGAFAEWDADGRVHLSFNGQGVWRMKDELARVFDLPKDKVRVTHPDVGGGFGMKGMPYPEYFILPHAARVTGRPVRWMSDRTEAMLTDNAGRDLTSTVELGFDQDLKITAYRVESICNLGAYNSEFAQYIQTELFSKVLTGTYDIQTAFLGVQGIYTNTNQVDAYRGAGRPEAIYVLERAMDTAARTLGVSPWELRKRNFIKPDAFPYRTASGELYDVGDFPRVLDRAFEFADVDGFAARRAASERQGKLRGLGLSFYIESILGAPSEDAAIEFTDSGEVLLYVGTQSGGQGHETVFAQFLSERSGIPMEDIRVVQGDSDRIARGGGTGGSRSGTTQATATLHTVGLMVGAFTPFLAEELGVDEADLKFDDGQFHAEGTNRRPTLQEAADMARTAGRADLLRHEGSATLEGRSYPNGAHLAEVEIDPDTGSVQLVGYHVVDDFGTLLNSTVVEGQVHGGVVQGAGQALMEHVVYDDEGQLLTASFMDYAMPRAADMPMIGFTTEPVPSTANPLGMKGCGEAGTVGSMAAVSNAVLDALWDKGVQQVDMPFTPLRVWQMLQEVSPGAAA